MVLRTYIPRWRWEAVRLPLTPMSTPQRDIYIHHSGDAGPSRWDHASPEAELEYLWWMEAFHVQSRGWAAISYSFVVMPSGRVYEGRGWGKVGTHTYNHDRDSHGICFAGHFRNRQPTERALRAAGRLIRRGILLGKVARDPNILGHRDVGAIGGRTSCPGENLYERLAELRP